jgi:hypothetical protein
MNRRCTGLLVVLASCVAVLVLSAPAQAPEDAELHRRLDRLSKRLDRLEERVSELEAKVNPAPAGRRHVLLLENCISEETLQYGLGLGAERAVGFFQPGFSDPETGQIDFRKLQAVIERKIPDPNARLFAMLDIERPQLLWLREGSGRNFARAQAELIAAVRLGKRLRPNVKWGMWGVPRVPRFVEEKTGKKQAWRGASAEAQEAAIAIARAPAALHAELDWFCPSVYDHSLNARHHEVVGQAQRAWARAVVQLADDIAGDRPVMAAVTHRAFNNNEPYNRAVISPEELISDQIAIAAEEGDGVIFWNGDHYYWSEEKSLQKYQPAEFATVRTEEEFWRHANELHRRAIKAMVETVKVGPLSRP